MLRRIRLELARTPDFPEGSHAHGYELVAPLTADGHLDVEAWQANRQIATVHRFWRGEENQTGQLVRTRGGRWAISYRPGPDDEDVAALGQVGIVGGHGLRFGSASVDPSRSSPAVTGACCPDSSRRAILGGPRPHPPWLEPAQAAPICTVPT